MKTRTNLITRKSLLKTLSGILCAALTMQLGLGLTENKAKAADDDKPAASVKLVIPDIYVGDTLQPQVTTDSTGYYFIYYKNQDSDMGYSTVEPVDAGYYHAIVLVHETDIYKQSKGTTYFHIYKRTDDTASVIIGDVRYGDSYNPRVSTKSNGTASFSYKKSNAPDSEYTSAKPTELGTYTVKAVIPETNAYNEVTCTGSFRIIKRNDQPTISISDVYIGDAYNPVVNTTSDGTVTITYKNNDVAGSAYTSTKPTALGNYTVKAVISETATYEELTCTRNFSIIKRTDEPTVSVSDTYVGDTFEPVVNTSSNGSVTYTYKNNDVAGSAFTSTKPTAAGNYTVKAVISETATYEELSCTGTFNIFRRTDDEATVIVADSYVGDSYTPVVSTISDGAQSFFYKNDDIPDSEFTTEKPTAAGNYSVMAVIAETDTYNELTCYDTFTISKRDATASVTVPDTFVGDSYVPKVVTVSNGTQSFLYKNEDIPDSEFTDEKPTAAGNYTVMAIIAESDAYNEITCTGSFRIIKRNDAAASVSVSDSFVGDSYEPKVTTKSTGSVTYSYRNDDIEESAFTATKPTAAGNYTVKAVIAETDTYKELTCYDTFSIKKRSASATVSVENIFVGGTVKPVVTTESDGKGDATFEYKAVNAADTEYSNTIPTAAGTYSVRATIPATAKYLSVTCSSEFTISLNKPSVMNLTVKDIYYGQTVSPTFETDSDGSVTIMYKLSTAPDSAYSTVAPTTTGKYTARATVSETAVYEGAACYKEFSISYLEAPQVAYNPTGKLGNDGYFTSDVQLAAPEGYTISATANGVFTKSIPYTEGMNTIYLKRDDEARTAAITITDKPRIDKVAPAIASSTGAIATGSIIYSSVMNITVSDTHLKSLKVNDEPVDIKTGTSKTITLDPENGIKTFVITAEDIAGNVTTIEFTLKAEWLENKIIVPDSVLPLEANENYSLDEGNWIVTKVTDDAQVTDSTVYNGNIPFCVAEDGDYTFTKVS